MNAQFLMNPNHLNKKVTFDQSPNTAAKGIFSQL
jgi:hypothetical protein